jgi:ABC-type phosphate/phosphonate transport system permease subunit
MGWENFFFPFRSELAGRSPGEIVQLATSKERLQPDLPNWRLIWETFWHNPDWQHNHVFVALLETFLMAVLGTLTAALVGCRWPFWPPPISPPPRRCGFSSAGCLIFCGASTC